MIINIIDRYSGGINAQFISKDSEYGEDLLSNEKSRFEIIAGDINDTKKGDLLLAKMEGRSDLDFFGVVESIENDILTASDIRSLLTGDAYITTNISTNYEAFLVAMFKQYITGNWTTQVPRMTVGTSSTTRGQYTIDKDSKYEVITLSGLFLHAFKKYEMLLRFKNYDSTNKIITATIGHTNELDIWIEDNNDVFWDWQVSTTEIGEGASTAAWIVNANRSGSLSLSILKQGYLNEDGTVKNAEGTPGNIRPSNLKIIPVTNSETETLDYQGMLEQELLTSRYTHEIVCRTDIDNKLVTIRTASLGCRARITVKGKTYPSVFTGYRVDEKTKTMELRFGNIRSRLTELLR